MYIYNKFIYVHRMIDDCYHYLKIQNNKEKQQYRGALSEVSFIKEAIHIEVTSRLFYIFNKFDETPHGSALVEEKREDSVVINIAENQKKGVCINEIKHTDISNTSNSQVKVFYPGSEEVLQFEMLQIHYNYWLELVLEHGNTNVCRDNQSSGIAKRISFGWGQKQSLTYQKSNKYKGIVMSFASFPEFYRKKTFDYPKELADIMSLGQSILNKMYKKENPMNDNKRNKLFGKYLENLWIDLVLQILIF